MNYKLVDNRIEFTDEKLTENSTNMISVINNLVLFNRNHICTRLIFPPLEYTIRIRRYIFCNHLICIWEILYNTFGIVKDDATQYYTLKIFYGQTCIFSIIVRSSFPEIRVYHAFSFEMLFIISLHQVKEFLH